MNKKPLWNIPSLHSSLPQNHWFCLSPLIALLLWWTTKHHWGIRQCRPAALWACTLCTLSFFSTFFFFFWITYLFWLLLICRLKSCIRLRSSRLCCLWCYYMEYYYKDVLKLGSWLRECSSQVFHMYMKHMYMKFVLKCVPGLDCRSMMNFRLAFGQFF